MSLFFGVTFLQFFCCIFLCTSGLKKVVEPITSHHQSKWKSFVCWSWNWWSCNYPRWWWWWQIPFAAAEKAYQSIERILLLNSPLNWPTRPRAVPKTRANNDEQLESIFCSHSWLQLCSSYLLGWSHQTDLIQVCFSQIFGFLFQNCSVYCLFGPCPACLLACLLGLYIKYITKFFFFNFLQLCVP